MSVLKTATALLVLAAAAVASVQGSGDISERIFGGKIARKGEIPYMVGLDLRTPQFQSDFCGGALISPKWILTTATCAQYNGDGQAFLGMTKIGDDSGVVTEELSTKSFYPNPNYNANTKDNDIALIELPSAVKLNDNIRPVDLPSKSMSPASYFDGYNASISGWGVYGPGPSKSRDLRCAYVTIMKKADCQTKMASYPNKPYPLTDNEICTAKDESRKGFCVRDYGGPVTVQNPSTNKPMIIGVMSFLANGYTQKSTCYHEYPGISTLVVPYLDWISQVTGISVS